jgi:uncharacterized protein (DUF1697 family)
MEELGYSAVRTLLNSGNIVFNGPGKRDTAARISKAMTERLGVSARVTVLTAAEIGRLVADSPLGDVADNPSRLLVSVPRKPSDLARLEPLTQQDWSPEVLGIGSRAAYLWCPNGILASKLPDAVGRALGDDVTARNWATIIKLHTLAVDDGSAR